MGEFKKQRGFNRGGNSQGQGFNRRGGSSSDRPRFGGDRGGFSRPGGDMGGRGDGARLQMFSAVCSECNRKCEVPFRPSGDRPVFCNDCFGNKRGSPQGNFTRRDFTSSAPASKPHAEDKRTDELKRQLDAVNKKLDTMMEMMKAAPKVDAVKTSLTKKSKVKKSLKAKK